MNKSKLPLHIHMFLTSLENARELEKSIQPQLLEFVQDKTYDLETRFEIWKKYCDKEHHPMLCHSFKLLDKWRNDMKFCYFEDRYRKITYIDLLDTVEDLNTPSGSSWSYGDYLREDLESVDQFKELLIENNFGSMINDW